MKVKDLIKKLEKFDGKTEVVMDLDENGWYSLEGVTLEEDENGHFWTLEQDGDLFAVREDYCTACEDKGYLEVCVGGDGTTDYWENQWCQECHIVMPDFLPPELKQ